VAFPPADRVTPSLTDNPLPCVNPPGHIFLPKEIRKPKDAEEGDSLSLKRHPVLVALSEGRLPEQRPNYEYFARILALNNQVVIRPKRCWIFVSNRDVVVREDGSGCLAPTGEQLAREQYPHIERNLEREKWAKEEQQIFQGTLLHEYTKSFSQVESSALRELSREWKKPFPDLHDRLETLMAENAQGDIVAAESQCDIIHMQVVLELNEKRRYPSHSELNSWVEISIEKPHLLHHRWKVETRLVRPAELSYANGGSAPELVYKTSADITVQCQHRPGCDGPRGSADSCHCLAQYPRRDWVTVPFPADVWAPTLSNCAEYPAHPFSGGGKRRVKKIKTEVKREDGGDEEEAKSAPDNHHPTQMDLVPQIAMMQEIWSCPPDDAQGPADPDSQGSKRWTRRGLILWSFKTLHSVDGNGKLATAESGKTTWRFLTVLDPVSEYHLQNSLLSNDRNVTGVGYGNAMARPGHIATGGVPMISRDAVMSPSPTYQQHHAATMSENFSTLWGAADVLDSMSGPAGQAYEAHLLAQAGAGPGSGHSGAYRLMSGYGDHGGLATPPPSACLTNTFAQTFDVSTSGPGHVAAYLSAGAQPLVDEPNSASHSFLSAAGSSVFDVPAYNAPDGLPSWGGEVGGGVTSMEAGGWPSNYITAPSGNQHSEPDLGWAPTHGADMRAGSVGSSHHSHQHQAPVPQQQHPSHRHHWAPDISADGREEFTHWSANTPAHTILNSHAARNGRPAWAAAAAARTASCSSATTTDDNHDGGSQGWEPVGRCDSSAPATVSDISQEWEEIDNSHHNNDNSASGSSASALSEDGPSMHEDSSFIEGDGIAAKPDTERHFTGGADVPEGGVSPSPAPRGIKRSREDSFDDDVDAAGGYRVAPMPFRLGR